MKEKGFTLLEVMIALFIFSIVIGLSYGLLISIEQVNMENRIYFYVMHEMQNENRQWRSNQDIASKSFNFEHTLIYQNVERYILSPHLERAEISYRWNVGRKEFYVHWDLDRFLP